MTLSRRKLDQTPTSVTKGLGNDAWELTGVAMHFPIKKMGDAINFVIKSKFSANGLRRLEVVTPKIGPDPDFKPFGERQEFAFQS